MASDSRILEIAETALAESWKKIKGRQYFRADNEDYVKLPEYNLIPTVSFADIESDYAAGAGQELKGKFCAAHSSAALVANSFGLFRNKFSPPIPEVAGIYDLSYPEFEKPMRIEGLRGTPPNPDVVFTGSDYIIAIESKFTEFLSEKRGEFRASYDKLVPKMEHGWRKVFERIREQPNHFGGFDAAQMVKHYLGIRCVKANRRSLAYLFWEPRNAESIDVFREHRGHIAKFAEMVKGSEIPFRWQSYADLWGLWEKTASQKIEEHIGHLKQRYLIGNYPLTV